MITSKSIVNGINLTSSTATFYTVPEATKTVFKKATFVNDHTIPVTVTINLVSSGSSAAYANALIKAKSLAVGETWTCYEMENQVLEAGGFLSMSASVTAKIGCRISGYEVT